jgi:hypothetical protein
MRWDIFVSSSKELFVNMEKNRKIFVCMDDNSGRLYNNVLQLHTFSVGRPDLALSSRKGIKKLYMDPLNLKIMNNLGLGENR